jgi:hypothetical protein
MLTFYTNFGIPARFAAYTRGPFIFIRPAYRDDAGLLAHERVHVRQWLRTLMLHPLLYALSDKYKLASEVEAYREQSKYDSDDCTLQYAGYLAHNYSLSISVADAHLKLRGSR